VSECRVRGPAVRAVRVVRAGAVRAGLVAPPVRPGGRGFAGVSAACRARGLAGGSPGRLTGRSGLRRPVRCPVPGGAAAAVTVAM